MTLCAFFPEPTADDVAGCGVIGAPLDVENRGLPLVVGELISACFFARSFFGDELLENVFL